jgi:hypothetical protein
MRLLVLATALAAGLSACTEENASPVDPSQAQPAQNVAPVAGPQAVESQIDWDKARTDFAKRPAEVQNMQIQAAGEDGPPPVPMLLPSGIAQTQGDRPVPPVVTKDGYFATYHLPRYDAIVNGSNKAYSAAGQAAGGDKSAMRFTTSEASASLSFSRYGADYTIDFECREVDGADSCITEAQAKEFADSLFVAQTR